MLALMLRSSSLTHKLLMPMLMLMLASLVRTGLKFADRTEKDCRLSPKFVHAHTRYCISYTIVLPTRKAKNPVTKTKMTLIYVLT